MKDALTEFKKDLEFLLSQTKPKQEEVVPADINDFPDLLQLQQYLPGGTKPDAADASKKPNQAGEELDFGLLAEDDEDEPVWDIREEKFDDQFVEAIENKEPGWEETIQPLPAPVSLPEERDEIPESDGRQTSTASTEPDHSLPVLDQSSGAGRGRLSWYSSKAHVGVDPGTRALKVVELHKTPRGFAVRRLAFQVFPDPPADFDEHEWLSWRSRQSEKLLQGRFKAADLIACTVTGLDVVYRQLHLPTISKKEMKEAIPWALRKELSYPIEEAVLDFAVIPQTEKGRSGKTKISVLVAPSRKVEEQIRFLQAIGITPAKLTAVPLAFQSLIRHNKSLKTKKVLIIELGIHTSHLTFIHEGVVDFHREITTAGKDFLDALIHSSSYHSKNGHLTVRDANDLLLQVGIPEEGEECPEHGDIPLDEMGVNIRPVLERLTNEIRRSIDYYKEKFNVESVDEILLSGFGACIKKLNRHLEKGLNEPVQLLHPFELAGIRGFETFTEFQELAPVFSVAVGLALDVTGPFNLLPAEYRSSQAYYRYKKIVQYAGMLMLLGFGMASGFLTLKIQQVSSDLQRLRTEYQKAEPLRKEFLLLKKRQEALQNRLETYRSKIFLNTRPVQHLRAISNLVPRNVALTSLSIKPFTPEKEEDGEEGKAAGQKTEVSGNESIILHGVVLPDRAREGSNLAAFLLKLKQSGYFQDIRMVDQETRADGSIRFIIHCVF